MALVFGALIAGVAVFMFGFFPQRMADQARASTELRARTIAEVMATAVAPALEFDDADNAARVLGWLDQMPDARFAAVVTDGGTRFAAWKPERIPAQLPSRGALAQLATDHELVIGAPIVGRGDGRGMLYLGLSLDPMIAERDEARTTVGQASLVVLAIGLVACVLLATALVRPLRKLTLTADEIARGARPPQIAVHAGGLEVTQMTAALGTMLERLNEANSQLVRASRYAGMAEVATGVLHNVGNVLNSVNVGIELVNEKVTAIPTDRVKRAGELLLHARGQGALDASKLDAAIKYVDAVAERIASERAEILAGLVTLRGHVDHVRRVVSAQNEFARAGGVDEHASVATLIDEAIALGCPRPGHAIQIVKHVGGSSHVKIDRHRVLQILVNLVTNARDSVTQHARANASAQQLIALSVVARDGWLEARVEDTGVGVAPEALRKIFSAGFTTKPKGHGYGLHSSALVAEQLGGTLRCDSAGEGHGASFVLRVPVEIARSHAA